MSLSGPPDTLIQKAVAKLASKGIFLVAAAGNDGPHNAGASYPAAYEDVIAVTAVNKNLQNYRYANRGSYVDIAAPGVAIWTALPGAQQGYHSGTSFATPYVTATLAAIYSQIGGQNSKSVLDRLQFRDLGEAGNDPVYGRGLLVAPASCTGGQIAAAPPASQPAPSLFSFFATSSPPAAPTAPAEELPWLSYKGSGN
jgi:subtilisin family serine protease